MLRQAEKLAGLLDDLLDIDRLSRGHIQRTDTEFVAAKYAPDGPVTITLDALAAGGFSLEVADRGPGIPAEQRRGGDRALAHAASDCVASHRWERFEAAALRAAVDADDVADRVVVTAAARLGAVVVTTDPDDLRALAHVGTTPVGVVDPRD